MQVVNVTKSPAQQVRGHGFSQHLNGKLSLAGNTVINAVGNNVVIRAIFDITTAIENPAGNDANATIKIFELSRRADRNKYNQESTASDENLIHSFHANG